MATKLPAKRKPKPRPKPKPKKPGKHSATFLKLEATKKKKAAATAKKKAADAKLNDPNEVTKPLTPKTLAQETEAATGLKFGDTERGLQAEQRASSLALKRNESYYDQYQKRLRDLAGMSNVASDEARKQLEQANTNAGLRDALNRNELAKREQDQAKVTGQQPTNLEQQRAVDAGASRENVRNTFGGQLALTTALRNMSNNENQRIGEGQLVDTQTREQNRRRQLNAKQLDVAQQKGAFRIDYRSGAREKERKHNLEEALFAKDIEEMRQKGTQATADRKLKANLATAQRQLELVKLQSSNKNKAAERNLARKVANLNAQLKRRGQNITSRDTRRGQSVTRRGQNITSRDTRRGQLIKSRDTRRGQNITRRGQDITSRDKRSGQTNAKKEHDKRVANARKRNAKVQAQLNQAIGLLKSKPRLGPDTARTRLMARGTPADVAFAAEQLVRLGYVGSGTANAWKKRYGIKLNTRKPKPKTRLPRLGILGI